MRHTGNSVVAITRFTIFILGEPQSSSAEQPAELVVSVIHVDARPADTRSAVALLDGFRCSSLYEAGAKGFEVLQEIGHPNHFTLVETWLDEKTYEAHNLARHTRQFVTNSNLCSLHPSMSEFTLN